MKTSSLVTSLMLTATLYTGATSAETELSAAAHEPPPPSQKKLSEQIRVEINQALDPTGLELMKKHKSYLIGTDITAWEEGHMYIGKPVHGGAPMNGVPKDIKLWMGGEWKF